MSRATCDVPRATCHVRRATCDVPRATCHVPRASRATCINVPDATVGTERPARGTWHVARDARYSYLNAIFGSAFAARYAGIQHAARAAANNSTGIVVSVN